MAEVIAGALRAIVFAGTLIFGLAPTEQRQRKISRHFYKKSYEYAKGRFGRRWERWALRLMLIDMDLLMQVSDIINTWNDMQLLKWNENLLGSFNAISVAGSVLASVDITALSLDSVSEIHWTTRAAFSVSLLTSVLSVVFCIRTQRQLYLIGSPMELRYWLCNGQLQNAQVGPRQLQSSIAATRVLQLPVELLTVSWVTFIAGLILYMSFMWRVHLDPGGVDYRNILICILLVLFILVGYYELMGSIKDVEQRQTVDQIALLKPKTEPPRKGNSASTALLKSRTEPPGKENSASTTEINAQDGMYGSALQAASAGGHNGIVWMLLSNGAKVNAQGGMYGSALQAASAEGHNEIARMLLRNGAEVNVQGGMYGSALQAASAGGHEEIVRMLLDKGVEVNAQGGHLGTTLPAVSLEGQKQTV